MTECRLLWSTGMRSRQTRVAKAEKSRQSEAYALLSIDGARLASAASRANALAYRRRPGPRTSGSRLRALELHHIIYHGRGFFSALTVLLARNLFSTSNLGFTARSITGTQRRRIARRAVRVDAVFALASSADARRGLYVNVTRAREDVTITYGKDDVRDFGDLLVRAQRDKRNTLVRDVEQIQLHREQTHAFDARSIQKKHSATE